MGESRTSNNDLIKAKNRKMNSLEITWHTEGDKERMRKRLWVSEYTHIYIYVCITPM